MYLPLHTIIFVETEFEKELVGYSVETYIINDFEKILLIEDSLILSVRILPDENPICVNAEEIYSNKKNNKYWDIPQKDGKYYYLQIEELTYNSIGFKYNHTKFKKKMESITGIDYIWFSYFKFCGYSRQIWDCCNGNYVKTPTIAAEINAILPELKIKDRYEAWEGLHYYIIVIEFEAYDKSLGVGIFYTTQKPQTYIMNKCKEWITLGFCNGNMNMIHDINGRYSCHIEKAFETWKGKGVKKQFLLENYLKYFYFEKDFRDKDDAMLYAHEISKKVCTNSFGDIERCTYLKPTNKWVTEELVYKLCKKTFKENRVIYQHRPFFLRGETGGQMSYDIFITGLNIAVEYQGKQHFEPVEFFGGEMAYQKTLERDKLKKYLSEKHGIKLVYINYWENVTTELIKEKINEMLKINYIHP